MCQKHGPLSVRLCRAGTQQARAPPPLTFVRDHTCSGKAGETPTVKVGEDTLRRGGSCWKEVLIINKRTGEVVEEETKTGKRTDAWCREGQKHGAQRPFHYPSNSSNPAHELTAAICGVQ